MAVSGIGPAANVAAANPQISQSSGHQRHGGHAPSISDVDAQGSNVAAPSRSTGRVGSKVDLKA